MKMENKVPKPIAYFTLPQYIPAADMSSIFDKLKTTLTDYHVIVTQSPVVDKMIIECFYPSDFGEIDIKELQSKVEKYINNELAKT